MSELTQADERLIDQVLSTHRHGLKRKRSKKIWIAAAVTMIPLAAAAASAIVVSSRARDTAREGTTPVESMKRSPKARGLDSPASQEEREVPPSETTDEKPHSADDNTRASSNALTKKSSAPSAGDLLARAQNARSTGAYAEAISVYRRLLSSYPGSAEARLAHVSLAQLLLAQGNAAAALSEFQAYERTGGGSHSQEAHYGIIQALQALGRSSEEKAEVKRYLKRFPNSAQAAALRKKLGKQDGSP